MVQLLASRREDADFRHPVRNNQDNACVVEYEGDSRVTGGPARRILVATDLSPQAGLAVTRAVQLADEHGAALSALYVLPDGLDDDLVDEATHELTTHLAEHAEGDGVEAVVRRGRAACEIAAEAVRCSAELTVVGARGERGFVETFLGTTADNLMRLSPVPVLLVRKSVTGPYRIVVLAVDTSEPSAAAARFGCELTPSAHHILVHACTVVGENLMRMHGASDEQIEELRATATELVNEDIMRLGVTLTPHPARVIVTPGYPPTRLLELSRSYAADAIVVGTGARSPVAYAFLGSVAQYVMRESLSDVLVVPAVEN
ncbi:universal stress protein UspE [Mycobacterium sp. THAF192]|nr:universal stress protein UspE [Mycobacterium sp. THAF192]